MLRSLSSGVSGLKAHQTKMDVIGNNIANVNTPGFKASRVTFQDVYYQTVSNATGSTNINGGTNPSQIGYGATVSSIDVINTNVGIQSTDRALDLYISGDGYFAVTDMTGATCYTRVGKFYFDPQGALVNSNGDYVMGWQPSYGSGVKASALNIPNVTDYTNISIGTDGTITGVYSGTAPEHVPNTFENVGSITSLSIAGYTNLSYENGVLSGVSTLTGETDELYNNIKFNADGSISGDDIATGDISVVIGSVKLYSPDPADYSSFSIEADGTIKALYNGHFTNSVETFGSINGPSFTIDGYTNVTYANGSITGVDAFGVSTTLYTNVKMSSAGIFTGNNAISGATGEVISELKLDNLVSNPSLYSNLTLKPDGTVTGTYTSVQVPEHVPDGVEVLGQIAIAKFANPGGLIQRDGLYFQQSNNSGNPVITTPGDEGSGTIIAGGLEMSNVNLANELTDMITTQRGFQANSRVITTSDQMLEELVNLKR